MKKIVLILISLMMTATHAGGQTIGRQAEILEHQIARSGLSAEDARTLVHSMQQAGFTEKQAERLGVQLSADNFPGMAAEPVRDKVLEGIAKRVAPERILQAAIVVEKRYAHAYELTAGMDQQHRVRLAQAYADCLAAGLTREDAARISSALESRWRHEKKTRRFGLRDETLLTAREMVRQGVSSPTTASVIGEALAEGYDEADMHTLRNSFRNRQRDNLEEAAHKFRAAISRGVPADNLGSSAGGGAAGESFHGGSGSESGHGQDSDGDQGGGSSGGSGSSDGGHGGDGGGHGGSDGSGGSDNGGGSGDGGSSGGGSSDGGQDGDSGGHGGGSGDSGGSEGGHGGSGGGGGKH